MPSKNYRTVEALESRVHFALTPASPRPDTLGAAFDKTERQALLTRLSNLPSGTYNTLNSNLNSNDINAFDTNLLNYMKSRTTADYFFDPANAGSIASYISGNLSTAGQVQNANWITDSRLFPAQGSADSFDVQLPANINWSDTSPSSNPEYIYTLNRQEYWMDLAQSYRYTSDSKYMSELLYELADWSSENPTFALPANKNTWTTFGFDISIRLDAWMMTYFSVLSSAGWTGAANSLFMYKVAQQADSLANVVTNLDPILYANNRANSMSRTELQLGLLFPEMDDSSTWRTDGRNTLYACLDAQFYNDGSHKEQSTGYASQVIGDILEAAKLDSLNGNTWSNTRLDKLENAIDSLWQQLSPNGNRPAIGDTYRYNNTTIFLKAALILNQSKWPEAKPRTRDVWIFGSSAIAPYMGNPVTPAVGTRGSTYSLSDSGNYILRSGSDANARQINFDAGPKGGGHGHYDLLNFEFFGYGRPLISDPGLYYYIENANRNWVISTKAHNTVGVADLNHGQVETMDSIKSSGIQNVAGGYMISAGHQGYFFTKGAPTINRSIWYDGSNTMVVVDFVEATTAKNFEQSFLMENQNTSRDLANGLVYTKNTDGNGNVRIQSLLRPGQTAGVQTNGVFTSDYGPPNEADPASRYYVQQLNTTYAVFATLITAHSGNTANSSISTASWVTVPTQAGQNAVLNVNGTNITFSPPSWERLNATAQSRGTANDIAYDSTGRLHMVFYDRDDRNLKYAVRDTNGIWSTVQTIDDGDYCGYNPSLAIDANGRPCVAYQDAYNGDLKYASLSTITNAWKVETVDVPGSTGGYPSLVMSRNNTPVIAYYNKTKGDLRMALPQSAGWQITTIDSVGDVGRFPSIQLDPNRPDASKFAVAYEDTTNGDFKWGIQYKTGWRYETIDSTTTIGGGYISMQFYDSGASSDRYKSVATYYDAGKGQLRYAYDIGGIEKTTWTSMVIASKKRQGLYSKLYIEANKPRVFFFDGTNNKAMFLSSTKIIGGSWSIAVLGNGGREIHYAYRNGVYQYSNLDEGTGYLTVKTK